MKDQAERLREIMKELRQKNKYRETVGKSARSSARVIAVTSGKGGVGKTNVTANLAIALSELGLRVAVIDADLGLANIEVVFGIVPKFNLLDVIKKKRNILEVMTAGPGNVRFISGGSGVEELADINGEDLNGFIDQLGILDKIFDIILIDTGGGISDNVMRFVLAADEVILITTPEPTSLTDAYALIKMVSFKGKKQDIKILVNRAEDEKEAISAIDKLILVTEKFLNVKLDILGYILKDETVVKAVKQQVPFIIYSPRCTAAKYLRAVSEILANTGRKDVKRRMTGFRNFLIRFVELRKT